MDKSLASLENDFSKIRAGRAHPSLLEQVTVEYYGTMVPLSQVSNITAEDARTLKVSPWEKDMVGPIEKAILTSDLGLNPNTQGLVMRIPLPPLTEDRRRELVRVVRDEAENARVAIRNIRRDAISDFRELLKEKEISEDDSRKAEDNIQKITDQHIASIDKSLADKENSLLEI
jgi:ribosome recycling factor